MRSRLRVVVDASPKSMDVDLGDVGDDGGIIKVFEVSLLLMKPK